MDAILDGMNWLGLQPDEPPVYQFARRDRHAEVARQMLANGQAYYCYCTPQELEAMRETARAEGKPPIYNGLWRDRDPKSAPPTARKFVRLTTVPSGDVSEIANSSLYG